jgi:hypothetical protein
VIGPVLDGLAAALRSALGPAVNVGDTAPDQPAGLPAATLGVREVTERLVGVGRIPRGTRTGALRLSAEIDLADPVLDLGGGETLPLLDAERRVLTLPHGPLVRADGTTDLPFTADDVGADDGTPFPVSTAQNPTGRRFRPDPDEGTFRFGQPLADTGTLRVTYHVGQWDVLVSRYQGLLDVDLAAADTPGLAGLTRDVEAALDEAGRAPGAGTRVAPRERAAATTTALGPQPDAAVARTRRLVYRFDAEIEQPLLTTGGGVIARVAVRAPFERDGAGVEETFDVTAPPPEP